MQRNHWHLRRDQEVAQEVSGEIVFAFSSVELFGLFSSFSARWRSDDNDYQNSEFYNRRIAQSEKPLAAIIRKVHITK